MDASREQPQLRRFSYRFCGGLFFQGILNGWRKRIAPPACSVSFLIHEFCIACFSERGLAQRDEGNGATRCQTACPQPKRGNEQRRGGLWTQVTGLRGVVCRICYVSWIKAWLAFLSWFLRRLQTSRVFRTFTEKHVHFYFFSPPFKKKKKCTASKKNSCCHTADLLLQCFIYLQTKSHKLDWIENSSLFLFFPRTPQRGGRQTDGG